ncbi:CYP4V2 [Cordylochernes scorpioides]|uniref:CYP4V2 n=1 Tax=Cordylochernes scorpioides TaxID=51811 RepID=A0ABY6K4H5_9ARAC|nr:CYP4V2 [Cordylochernes scorpioides]
MYGLRSHLYVIEIGYRFSSTNRYLWSTQGHDTTATGISWTLYHLGRHPEILRKVQEEVDAVLYDDWPIRADDLKQLKYLEMVIKESNRITPPIPLLGRIAHQDTTVDRIGGEVVKK